jgi:ABC-type glutathione transport system ATPase component
VEQGKTVLLSTHDIHTARTWADSIVVMDSGRVVEPDEAAAVLAGL